MKCSFKTTLCWLKLFVLTGVFKAMEQSRRGRVNMNIMQVNPPPASSAGSVSAPLPPLTWPDSSCDVTSDWCSYSLLTFSSSHSSCCCRWTSEETPPEDQTPADGRDVQRSGRSVTALLSCLCVGTSTCFCSLSCWCDSLGSGATLCRFLDKTLFYFISSLTEMEINIENKTSGSDVGKWLPGSSD